ncbi:MAG: SemiSWEET family transporter [Candidatus Moranbacteria bacterium]|jgi:MtN3 and saliva related transmembrane protein|nr:SemiSWEET family transporter [Candidatus Moranbacteria bacterium]
MAELFGIVGGVLNTIRLFPQVIKSLKTKKTQGLSGYFVAILFLQSVFLIAYGATKPDNIILYTNIAPLFCTVILAKLKIQYK